MTQPLAAWTPDAPDDATPSEAIAAGFNPESLDHFDEVEASCGEVFAAIRRLNIRPGHDEWYRDEIVCTEIAGHHPDTPHMGEVVWGAEESIPAEPECADCSDVGVQPGGTACHCPAGRPFREAEALKADAMGSNLTTGPS